MTELSQCPPPLCSKALLSLAGFREHCAREHSLVAPEMKKLAAGGRDDDDENGSSHRPDTGDFADSSSADEATPYDGGGIDSVARGRSRLVDLTNGIPANDFDWKNGRTSNGGARSIPPESGQASDNIRASARPDVTQPAMTDLSMASSPNAIDASGWSTEVENAAESCETHWFTSHETRAPSPEVSVPHELPPPRCRPLTPPVSTTGHSTSSPRSPQHLRKAYVCELPSWVNSNVACTKVCRDKYARVVSYRTTRDALPQSEACWGRCGEMGTRVPPQERVGLETMTVRLERHHVLGRGRLGNGNGGDTSAQGSMSEALSRNNSARNSSSTRRRTLPPIRCESRKCPLISARPTATRQTAQTAIPKCSTYLDGLDCAVAGLCPCDLAGQYLCSNTLALPEEET